MRQRILYLLLASVILIPTSLPAFGIEIATTWDPTKVSWPICDNINPNNSPANCFLSAGTLPPKNDQSAGCAYGTQNFNESDILPANSIKTKNELINLSNKRGYCDAYFKWPPESFAFSDSGVSYLFVNSNNNQQDQHLCTGEDDPTCAASKWPNYKLFAELNFWSCEKPTDLGCVLKFEVIGADGLAHDATFSKYLPDTPKVQGKSWEVPDSTGTKKTLSYPTGGGYPIFEYKDPASGQSRKYLVLGSVERTYDSRNGYWTNPNAVFTLQIFQINVINGQGGAKPVAKELKQNLGGQSRIGVTTQPGTQGFEGSISPGIDGCTDPIAKDLNTCATIIPISPDRIRISLNTPDDASLFLQGRVDYPIAYTKAIAGGHTVVIEAGPGSDYMVAGNIAKAKMGQDLVNAIKANSNGPNNDQLSRAPTDFPSSVLNDSKIFTAFLPYAGNRSSLTETSWILSSSPRINQYLGSCINESAGQILGLVSTNATLYSDNPPSFDKSSQTISYSVDAPHFNSDGTTPAVGKYFLNMNAKFMQCLLGVAKVPSVASLAVTYENSGTPSVSTVTVKQDSDWLRMAVDNFHFSSPKLQIKFADTAQNSSPTATKPTPAPAGNNKVITITCIKGKMIKKIVGSNPICPSGYKKK